MKFSIVTISYNQAKFLEQAIRSVIEQDYPDIEYIVVDPGSTDGSREIIERYRHRITKIIFERDNGPADGLNKGFAIATGDIYGYLNADDIYAPRIFGGISNYFINNPGIDVVSGHGYVIDDKSGVIHKIFSHKFDLGRYCAGFSILIQQSTFFRSNIYRKSNGFNINNRVSWDGEFAVDMSLHGAQFAVFHDYWSCFRVYSKSISGSSEYLQKLNAELVRIREKVGFKRISIIKKFYLWITGWLLQPITLTLRIIDGVNNRNRLL